MSETEEECQFCGGCEEVDVQLQAGGSDVVACPACMARDKNQAIARRDAEIERLRAALKPFATIGLWRDTYPDAKYDRVMTCPCVVEQIKAARVALGHEQKGDKS